MKFLNLASVAGTVVFAGAVLTGCKFTDISDLADLNVLNQAREYFPAADVSHPHPGALAINTHVGNISEKFAAKVMGQVVMDHRSELSLLPIAGYSLLAVMYDNGGCSWLVDKPLVQCSTYSAPTPMRFYLLDGSLFVPNP